MSIDGSPTVRRVEFETALSASMIAIDGTWRQPCQLLDISEEGAKLEIDGKCAVEQGREFFLVMSWSGAVYRRCQLAWLNGETLGVRFITSDRKGPRRAAA